ncbi:ESPR-type extended signal peptide-containing protein [Stenotrophomonas maltophilia]|uniref:ESPR-type extended signal peptide-containing protein n=1 Tax=Stenotrophomonas maltophilia TaxID=40324 RepID=UPI0022F39702|nr:ESPR-type extended signal peptide-containing protein [Stenotrophomonas maltophilia]MDA5342555.1 YadA-like family protein [Stenotrophomonas maltophilia]
MNRIYRRIWNAARQCWVVASELSSPRGKPAQTRVLMSALLLTTASGAFAANETDDLEPASESRAGTLRVQRELIPLLSFAAPNTAASAIAPRGFYNQVAIVTSGNYADAQVSGADVLALGSRAKIYGTESTGLGNYAETSGGYATAVGHYARAFGGHGTALGTKAYANGKGATALGHDSQATSSNAVAIGSGARATQIDSVAIGANSTAYEAQTVSVGNSGQRRRITNVDAGRSGNDAVNVNQLNNTDRNVATVQAVANTARNTADSAQSTANTARDTANTVRNTANSAKSVADAVSKRLSDTTVKIGAYSSADKADGVAVGAYAAAGLGGVAVGRSANSLGDRSVAVGNGATAKEIYTSALGNLASASGTGASALGYNTSAEGTFSTSIGYGARTRERGSVALGYRAEAVHEGSVALGNESQTNGSYQVSIGNATRKRKLVNMSDGLVAQGSSDAVTGNQLYATNATATGAKAAADSAVAQVKASSYLLANGTAGSDTTKAKATGTGALASGIYTEASGTAATAMGRTAKALAEGAIAIGDRAGVESVTSKHSIAIGTMAKTGPQEDLLAIGRNANASGGAGAMALGYGSTSSHLRSVALGSGSTTSAQDQVSVGSTSIKRKIVNVANGSVTSTSNEAVTGAQLFSTDKLARDAQTGASNALSKAVALEGLVKQVSVAGDIRMGSENSGTVLDVRNKNDGKRKISGLADGALSVNSSDAVNGAQLDATNGRVASAQLAISDAVMRLGGLEDANRHIAIGAPLDDELAKAGRLGIAFGDSAVAAPSKDGAVALGSYSRALGENSVALGRASWVHDAADGGFALGTGSVVEERGGLALGTSSAVKRGALNAVSIGDGSIALESLTVSFGDGVLQRRLTNIARGTADHNATTVGQLNESLATLGGGAKLDANGNVTAPTYRVQNTDQRTVGGALAILDGAVLRTTSRVDGMEGQLRSIFQDTATTRADGFNQLTLAGAQGMVISNVANGLIAAGSREAINGGQLHAVQQQLNGRIDGLEQRVESQGPVPQSRAMALASTEQEAAAPTPPATQDDKVVADTGNAPKSSPAPQPKAEASESPKPQVDTAELEKMLARANDYSDGIAREVDARLNKMDKRFNRMAAMSSAQTAMAMNTAGLATYNRLGAGVGYAEGESAMAVGYQRVLNDKGSATFSLNGAFTNSGERSVGVGVGIGW